MPAVIAHSALGTLLKAIVGGAVTGGNEYAMIDATIIRARQASGGAKRGNRASEGIGAAKAN